MRTKKLVPIKVQEPPKLPTFMRRSFGAVTQGPGAGAVPSHPVTKGKISVHPVHAAGTLKTGTVRPTTSSPTATAAIQQEVQISRNRTNAASLHTRVLQAARDSVASRNASISRSTTLTRVNPPRATIDRATGRTRFANAFSRTEFKTGGQVSYNMRRAQNV